MISLPVEVPRVYREELDEYQNRINILIRNNWILRQRILKFPQTKMRSLAQISIVEKLLLRTSEEQKPVIENIREFLKKLQKSDSNVDAKADDDSSVLVIDDDVEDSNKDDNDSDERETQSRRLSIDPVTNQYPGHVSHVDKLSNGCDVSLPEEETEPFQRREMTSEESQSQSACSDFMLHLGLLNTQHVNSLREFRRRNVQKMNDFRNMTYIPEVTAPDKRIRRPYGYMMGNDLRSPPTLRNRINKGESNCEPKSGWNTTPKRSPVNETPDKLISSSEKESQSVKLELISDEKDNENKFTKNTTEDNSTMNTEIKVLDEIKQQFQKNKEINQDTIGYPVVKKEIADVNENEFTSIEKGSSCVVTKAGRPKKVKPKEGKDRNKKKPGVITIVINKKRKHENSPKILQSSDDKKELKNLEKKRRLIWAEMAAISGGVRTSDGPVELKKSRSRLAELAVEEESIFKDIEGLELPRLKKTNKKARPKKRQQQKVRKEKKHCQPDEKK